ncbi:spore germination protein [Neobacillus pocheonensis]|uniref:Spore germination protein n=1 Tax=Neobacillus pocheonensis TaxID=363869 RepID=A0ABT0WEC8_9BACI|nr:spore germination protein [Neobacillus pocheonensis]
MNQKQIYAIHIYILMIISTGFTVHVLGVPALLTVAKRDAWISTICSSIPVVIWMLLVFYLYKKLNNDDIISFLQKTLSKWAFSIFAILSCIFFLSNAFITLKFTLYWAKANYTQDIPDFVVILLFSFICYYSAAKGLRTISVVALVLLPLVVFFGFLVGLGNMPNKNYELLFPIFENGYKSFFLGLTYASTTIFEVFFILYLTSELKDKLKLKWLIVVVMILVELSFGPLVGAIAEFGSVEAEKMRNPAYEEWKLLTIGQHITRLDFLSIFQWLSGAFIRVSISLFISAKLFSYNKKKKWVLPVLCVLLFIAACINWDATSLLNYSLKVYYPISRIFEICTMLFLLLVVMVKGDKQ